VTAVGLTLACPAVIRDYPEQEANVEAMALAELGHRYPGVRDMTTRWVWVSATSFHDENGELVEVPAHWGLHAEGIIG
jgi:hypothetical protein